MKNAVRSLLKKPSLDPGVLANYRLISDHLFITKKLKRLVVSQPTDHPNRNSLFEMFQSDVSAHRSTETALAEVTHDLLMASDCGRVSILTQQFITKTTA